MSYFVLNQQKKRILKIPVIPEVRLSNGLFLSVNVENHQLIFTQANLDRMRENKDVQVKGRHSEII